MMRELTPSCCGMHDLPQWKTILVKTNDLISDIESIAKERCHGIENHPSRT